MSVIEIRREERPRQCDCCPTIAPGYALDTGGIEYHACDDCFRDADEGSEGASIKFRRESLVARIKDALRHFESQNGALPRLIMLGREVRARLEFEQAGLDSPDVFGNVPIYTTERRGVVEVY